MSVPIDTGALLDEHEAAAILNVSLTTVRRWRREGRGPVYRKLGGGRVVRYRPEDLNDFIAGSRRISTAQRVA